MRRARLLLLAMLALLPACSMLRVAYDNAQPALRYAALDYFPLEHDQREALDQALARFHARHRAQELPRYAGLLREARARWSDGLTEADLEWALNVTERRYTALVDAGIDDAARLLAGLTPAQVDGFAERLRESNASFAREQLQGSRQDQLEQRAELLIERIEGWYGKLDEIQAGRIFRLSLSLPHAPALRLAERERRQAELLLLLRRGLTAEQLKVPLREWAVHWRHGRSPAYERAASDFRARSIAMAVEVDAMMRPDQRRRALDRLDGYIADIGELLGETPTARRNAADEVCAGPAQIPCG